MPKFPTHQCDSDIKVAFTEKIRQCQQVLLNDFSGSCMFKDQMDMIDLKDKVKVTSASTGEDARKIIQTCSLRARAPCLRHGGHCTIPEADINLFGAPCVDDSPMGKRSMDDGLSRRVPWMRKS